MSIFQQKLVAVAIFAVIMTAWAFAWYWVVNRLPMWVLDAFFFGGLPIMIVASVVGVYRHRKAGGHLRKR